MKGKNIFSKKAGKVIKLFGMAMEQERDWKCGKNKAEQRPKTRKAFGGKSSQYIAGNMVGRECWRKVLRSKREDCKG